MLKKTPLYPIWKEIGIKHHHGIQILLSSIYSKESIMIGDFFDLVPLIHWCQKIGFSFIQLLPIQDTAQMTSPYSALSSLALHPIYINLPRLPYLDQLPKLQETLSTLKTLPQGKHLDFALIYEKKIAFLRTYFEATHQQYAQNPDFTRFINKHSWLEAYSLYKTFADEFNSNNWKSWPEDHQNPTDADIKTWKQTHHEGMLFHKFCQFIATNQLHEVKNIAEGAGVRLKGDIPILISPYSSDVWHQRHYFHIDEEVGSRPSKDDPNGQHWGFPSFNWRAHVEDNFTWWRNRLQVASQFFSLYRIDHFVGLFRLWVIPQGAKSTGGSFKPELETQMIAQGSLIFSQILNASSMLPIAEVMGIQPPFVKEVLLRAGVPYLKITRYPTPDGNTERFLPVSEFDPLTIATVSTHDIPPLRLWWQQNPEQAEAFAKVNHLSPTANLTPEDQFVLLKKCHSAASLFHANLLSEYLAMVPELSYEDPQDDVINIPGTQNETNWCFRYKISLESIVTNGVLCEKMRQLL